MFVFRGAEVTSLASLASHASLASLAHVRVPRFEISFLIFCPLQFETSEEHKAFKSLMLDFFRGEVIDKINLAGLDKVIGTLPESSLNLC
jgi:hypothetical protein